ncbi:MAG: acylphosphatase [Rhodovibrionaceae bacterium]|nr:acylphosphatase [Rhodovibrionaceae bacterium]
MKSVRVILSGRVQGVFFRAWTVEQASKRGLDGWVRNLDDGRVEALFAGDPTDVDDMIEACWDGPGMANVTDVDVKEADPPAEKGFREAPTV